MSNAMNTITNGNGYPIFAANQVLKYTDLNSLVAYLDQQTRLTRTHLIGIGIVCGLEPSSNYLPAAAKILISEGCGVTSEGYLIALSETVLTHYQPDQSVTAALFNPTDLTPPASPPPQVKVTELFALAGINRIPLHQTPEGNQRDESAFTSFLTNQVLVVVWEPEDAQRDSCLVDCDDRGQDRSFRPRFFLLPQQETQKTSDAYLSAEGLLRQGYKIDQLAEPWHSWSTQAIFEARYTFLKVVDYDPRVLRFGYSLEKPDGVVRLTNIPDYKTFSQGYYKVCLDAISAIDKAFPQLFRVFSPFFAPFHPLSTDFSGLKDHLIQRLNAIVPVLMRPQSVSPATAIDQVEAQYALQYFYDYLSQLVAAYRELVETAFDLMADCTPETQRFPKFLLLGLVPSPGAAIDACTIPSAYRSHFTQPPLYNGNGQRIQQVRHLYERLVRLCKTDSFYLLPFYDTPLKVTPSKDRSVPLSEQAIPYYLHYPNLYRYWSYDDCRKGRSDRHPAYFYPAPSNTPFIPSGDLIYRLDEANFYRIEGHIGEGNSVALQRIRDYQQRYNLPFDVITLKLGTEASLNDLTISGQFDDLEADFGRMRDKFHKLWMKYDTTWQTNVFLQTLKQVFFDQTSLTTISYTQLFNPVLALASKTEAYDFINLLNADNQPTKQYHLQLKNAEGTPVARFVTERDEQLTDLVLDFSGLSEEASATEKTRIKEDLMACLGLGKVTYGVEPQASNNPMSYYVRLSVEDELNLPIDPQTNRPRGTASISLLTLNYFSVNFVSGQYRITQSEFQDFETLYGLLRDIPENYATHLNLPFRMGDRHAADCFNYFELKGLMEAYKHRLEKLMELHLFHKFAQYHPGMEHLGGVPKGGTFILVYVDGKDLVKDLLTTDRNPHYQARTPAIQQLVKFPVDSAKEQAISEELLNREDMVVADFCLPYRCCSTTPAVNYLLAQPRPIVLLEKTVFCEDDEKRYEFILDPAEGTLKGEGVVFADGKYYFQPSLIEQNIGREVAITFTYVVEGSYDTLTVTIYPEPEATLFISQSNSFCADATPAPITLNTTTPHIELVRLTIAGEKSSIINPVFDPKQYATNERRTVEIVALIRDRLTQCENTISQTVTVYPLLDTGFSLAPETTDGGYCAGKGGESVSEVMLRPNHPSVSNRFKVNGEELPTQRINLNKYSSIKDPVSLTLVHYAEGEGGCKAQSEPLTITVFPLPDANFKPAVSTAYYSVCANGAPVALNPVQAGGTFCVLDPQGNPIEGAIKLNPPQFIPSAVLLGEAESVWVTIEHTLVGQGNCSAQSIYSLTVHKAPVGSFDLSIAESNAGGFTVLVSNIQPAGNVSYSFDWDFGSGIPTSSNPRNTDFTIRYAYTNFKAGDTITISLTVTNSAYAAGCSGGPVSRQISVPFGVRELQLLVYFGPPPLSHTPPVTTSGGPLVNNQVFKISDFSSINRYEIEAETLPPTVGSVVFTYVDPDDREQNRPPTNSPPYLMIGGWQPRPGVHKITAQAFAGLDGAQPRGDSLSVSFTITNVDNPDNPTPGGGENVTVFNRRSSEYQTQLNQLGENGNLRRSRPYQLAERVLAADSEVSIPEAIERYDAFTQSLAASYRQSGDDRKAELTQLMSLSTARLLDRLVTDDLEPDLGNRLNTAIATLRAVGLDLSAIKSVWKPEDLSDAVDVARLSRLDELVS